MATFDLYRRTRARQGDPTVYRAALEWTALRGVAYGSTVVMLGPGGQYRPNAHMALLEAIRSRDLQVVHDDLDYYT